MPTTLYPPSRPQSVGEILDLAFRIFGATLVKCLPYAALGVISGQLPTLYDLARGRTLLQATVTRSMHDPLWWLLYLVAMVGTMTLTNAVILRQYALATGHAAAAGVELGTSIRRIPGLLLIGVLVLLAVVGCCIPLALIAALTQGFSVLAMNDAATHGASAVMIVLLLLVVVSWLVIRWSCSATVYLLTSRGPVESMTHSWRLTAGGFWRLSLIYTVCLVLIVVLYVLSGVISGAVSLVFARGDVAVITAATAVTMVLLGAFATPFYWALALAVLGDLSVRKEGTDLAQRIATPATQ
jgi:hypothetical protein